VTGLSTIVFSGFAWLVPAIGAFVVIAAALLWAGGRGATDRWVRAVCAVLKLGGVAVLAAALLEPLWVRQRARPGANYFALIAQSSA